MDKVFLVPFKKKEMSLNSDLYIDQVAIKPWIHLQS